jgi:hypothetical protein
LLYVANGVLSSWTKAGPGSGNNVRSGHYDIIRKEKECRLLWLEPAENLDTAKSRIRELASFWPGEFQMIVQDSHQLVAATEASPDSAEDTADCDPTGH